jgi:pimeloyl-ACP methyl ester carboxylesterase
MVLGGLEQWVTIRGTNDANPLLLVVHGGPASPYTPFNPQLASWERLFTVAQWDQRGAGKTYLRAKQAELSVDLIVSDGVELTRRLRDEFPGRPVILLGSSVGTVIAWKMGQAAPELFDGYVGANQVGVESRAASWRETRAAFERSGNRKRVTALDAIGANPSLWTPEQAEQVSKHAIAASPDVPDMVFDLMLPALMFAPEYSMSDIQSFNVAMSAARDALHADLLDPDLTGPMPLPVLLVHGAADLVNPLSAVEQLMPLIGATHRELVVVPGAGHLVEFADVDGFARILNQHVLTQIGG